MLEDGEAHIYLKYEATPQEKLSELHLHRDTQEVSSHLLCIINISLSFLLKHRHCKISHGVL